jgi:hypothetical protein
MLIHRLPTMAEPVGFRNDRFLAANFDVRSAVSRELTIFVEP